MSRRILAGALAVVAALFTGLIVWAAVEKGVGEGFSVILAERWGIVALVDLYLGFIFISAWIFALERRVGPALAWTVALFFLGNLVTIVYFVVRILRTDNWREALLGAAPPIAKATL